jgi:transcriptional regulator with XRE-family HTH domain
VVKNVGLATQRKKAGLTQMQVAAKLGITDSAVAQWEMGLTHPKFENLIKLSKLYKCSVDKLLKEE